MPECALQTKKDVKMRSSVKQRNTLEKLDKRENFRKANKEKERELESKGESEQGINSLKKLKVDGKAGLFINMVNPEETDILEWWVFYKENDLVYIQNHFLLFENLNEVFNINNSSKYILERETLSEDGELISEWSVSMQSIEEFINNYSRLSKLA